MRKGFCSDGVLEEHKNAVWIFEKKWGLARTRKASFNQLALPISGSLFQVNNP
jgi:hypothetical protein